MNKKTLVISVCVIIVCNLFIGMSRMLIAKYVLDTTVTAITNNSKSEQFSDETCPIGTTIENVYGYKVATFEVHDITNTSYIVTVVYNDPDNCENPSYTRAKIMHDIYAKLSQVNLSKIKQTEVDAMISDIKTKHNNIRCCEVTNKY